MVHVAILNKKYIEKILEGSKVIESRLYRTKQSPWDLVKPGDVIYLKESGGNISVRALVGEVKQIELNEKYGVCEIKEDYGRYIDAEDSYYKNKEDSKYAILISLERIYRIDPIAIRRSYGSAWLTYNNISELDQENRYQELSPRFPTEYFEGFEKVKSLVKEKEFDQLIRIASRLTDGFCVERYIYKAIGYIGMGKFKKAEDSLDEYEREAMQIIDFSPEPEISWVRGFIREAQGFKVEALSNYNSGAFNLFSFTSYYVDTMKARMATHDFMKEVGIYINFKKIKQLDGWINIAELTKRRK